MQQLEEDLIGKTFFSAEIVLQIKERNRQIFNHEESYIPCVLV